MGNIDKIAYRPDNGWASSEALWCVHARLSEGVGFGCLRSKWLPCRERSLS